MKNPLVGIVMGSSSDLSIMEEAAAILRHFDIPYEMTVASAHRSPEKTREYARSAQRRGLNIIIAGAGGAAHLAGFIASETVIPVIGVPIESTPLRGMDALLATVQMPSGVPVATMAVGRSGAKNAGILAMQILSLHRPDLTEKLLEYKEEMAHQVEEMGTEVAKHRETSDKV
ncbi:MAG: 5-(carboxyamino)imidazole ribonucleotide mutase [Deltaproteobacteria bacterium]|nr:MAG: 5-(carboxyamino)imidazole ribonucleotide mutase [Deltaproteobacteria bacterium]